MTSVKLPILSEPMGTLKTWSGPITDSITDLQSKFTPISNWNIRPFSTVGLTSFTSVYGRQCVINNLCHYMGQISVVISGSPGTLIQVIAPMQAAKAGIIFGSASMQFLTNVALAITSTVVGDVSRIEIRRADGSLFTIASSGLISFSGFYEID